MACQKPEEQMHHSHSPHTQSYHIKYVPANQRFLFNITRCCGQCSGWCRYFEFTAATFIFTSWLLPLADPKAHNIHSNHYPKPNLTPKLFFGPGSRASRGETYWTTCWTTYWTVPKWGRCVLDMGNLSILRLGSEKIEFIRNVMIFLEDN
jgi:hypothetical protein